MNQTLNLKGDHSEAIAKLVKTALDETRMLELAAQILLGFELSGAFRNGFADLPQHARYLEEVYLEGDPRDVLFKKALMGALALYLDFINLFVMLLQLVGQRRE